MLRDPTVILHNRISGLKEKLKTAIDLSRKNLSAFRKFKLCSQTIQSATSMDHLPGVLDDIRSRLRLDDLFAVLVEEEYAGFVPLSMQLLPRSKLMEIMAETGTTTQVFKPVLGSVAVLNQSCPALASLAKQRWQTICRGSMCVFFLTDKYRPEELVGLLVMTDKRLDRFHPDMATDFIEYFADSFAWTLVTLHEHERLLRESTLDHLTGCHNRNYLAKHAPRILDFANRKGFPMALLFIDLDKFKSINDNLGHACGDRILAAIAQSIRSIVREYDFFIRLGGDEFLVLLPDADEKTAHSTAKRIQNALDSIEISRVCGQDARFKVSASIGVAMYEQGESLEDFIDRADKIMYAAKNRTTD